MSFYLTISEGESPIETTPIFATSDPKIISAVAREVARRLGGEMESSLRRVLPLSGRERPSEGSDS